MLAAIADRAGAAGGQLNAALTEELPPFDPHRDPVGDRFGPLHLGLGYEKRDDLKQIAIRALYEFGAFTLGGLVQRDNDFYGAGNRTYFRLSGMYAFGANELHLNVGRAGAYSDEPDATSNSATQWTLGYNYNLSKRTKVYGYYTAVNGDDAGRYTLADPTANGKFNAFAVGIRHNF